MCSDCRSSAAKNKTTDGHGAQQANDEGGTAGCCLAVIRSCAVRRLDRARSDRSFDETVQQLQWAFGGYGLTTVTAIDYREILRQIKVDTGRAVVFEVMRREWLKTLLTEDPALGCIMPIRIYVFENADAMTLVSYQKAGAQLQVHSKESVRDFGRQLDQKLDALVALATKRHSSNR